MENPSWPSLSIPEINYHNIQYYSAPKSEKAKNLEEVNPVIIETFEKLGVPILEQQRLDNCAVDAVFDSISIGTTYTKKLKKYGVIFCSMTEAVQKYPHLVRKYLASVVPLGDNFFSTLNSAVFSDGSFCYLPKDIKCPLDIYTYFRINNEDSGQFERTLIVAEERSSMRYLEGCTAPEYKTSQLHAAVVELIALSDSYINYATVQNWYAGDEKGIGGVYNFVTKRGVCSGARARISWTQVETGSSITWKYPSCVLIGEKSIGEFYSIALTTKRQQADTGSKMIHLGEKTTSRIVSKGISSGESANTYRGLVSIGPKARKTKNFSQCDSLLLGNKCRAYTYPKMVVQNSQTTIEHEASSSNMAAEQKFYLFQRGIDAESATCLIVNGFCEEIFSYLPSEFSTEADKLLNLKLVDSVG